MECFKLVYMNMAEEWGEFNILTGHILGMHACTRRNKVQFTCTTKNSKALCHSRCGARNIPPCSKAIRKEQRPKFYSLDSPVMMTSPYEQKIFERTLFID